MFTKFDQKTKIMGFGSTEEEAEEELRFNMARHDINSDTSGYYLKRRQELYSWMPLPTLLAIKSLGSISYTNGILQNTVTKKIIEVEPKPLAHYLYLYYILDGKVSFKDFTVTMAKEVNGFLSNISPFFGTLDDFPYTKPGSISDAVNIHYLKCGGFVCDTNTGSILVCDGTHVLSVDLLDNIDKDCLISYGLAKLGIAYNGKDAYVVDTK